MAAYKAGQSKNMDTVVEAADTVTTACMNCHDVYREKTPAQGGLGRSLYKSRSGLVRPAGRGVARVHPHAHHVQLSRQFRRARGRGCPAGSGR